MTYDRSYYEIVSDFFEMSAIAIRNAVDLRPSRETYEERYLQTAKHYKPEQLQKFSQALAILQKEISSAVDGNAAFADWAGEIYMTSQPPTAATAIEPPKIDKTGQYLLF